MEASCASDAYGAMAGNSIEQADAEQAYVQGMFLGNPYVFASPEAPVAQGLDRQELPRSYRAYETRSPWASGLRRKLGTKGG